MSQSLIPFVLFALVASISPGPTNLLILANGASRGLRASVAPVFAACAGAAGVVLLVGMGLGALLLRHPNVQHAMSVAGVLWLSYLAWQLWREAAAGLMAEQRPPFRARSAAALQVINPKVWLMALAVIGVFATPARPVWHLALVFFLIALPCMAAWALLGAGSARWLRSPRQVQRFNRTLALTLLIAAWWTLLN